MKNFVVGIVMLFVSLVSAQTSQELFKEANSHYQLEAYDLAVKSYKDILNKGVASSELYFNLGNAYYKTNNIAEAIYYYEKALVLNPSHKDAKVNLAFANRGIIDSIKVLPKSAFEKFNNSVLAIFSFNNWAKIAVVLSLFAGALWLLFFFSVQSGLKKLFFTMGIVLSVLCVVSLVVTNQQYQRAKHKTSAIVFANEVAIKNAPRKNASEVFTLHQGTKVEILDEVGAWQKIKIADGQIGWLLEATIRVL